MTFDSEMSESDVTLKVFTFSLSNVTMEDSGTYICFVINSLVELDKTMRYNMAVLKVRKDNKGNYALGYDHERSP